MKLFPEDSNVNHLPMDGEVYYYGRILDHPEAIHYYHVFMEEIDWRNDESIIFGKRIVTARKVAWYADNPFPYRYSGTTKTALPWTDTLLELKRIVEQKTGSSYNSCLLNLYHHGDEGMGWHSDAEKELAPNGSIASISLGAERKFAFKHKKSGDRIDVFLEDGSLLEMTGATQLNWLHRLPPTKKVKTPRVNLTFRRIITR